MLQSVSFIAANNFFIQWNNFMTDLQIYAFKSELN